MKKIILFISLSILLGLSSCVSYNLFTTYTGSVDYYSAGLDGKVFLTESNSVNFDYIPIGSISSYQRSGYLSTDKKDYVIMDGDPIYGYTETKVSRPDKNSFVVASLQTLLTEASRTAIAMGGDAIINLKVSYLPDDKEPTGKVPYMTGMVVKRK